MSRAIFIGDVHGCSDELAALLDRLGVTRADAVYFVGDLVARGPSSRAVLAQARALEARAVRGNHEHRLLEVRAARAQGDLGPRLGPSHEHLYAELDAQDWEQIASFPLWLELPGDLCVVHAGLRPDRPLTAQKPQDLLTMRTLRRDGSTSDRLTGKLWGERYRGGPHVVFGHNAITGLQLHRDATGLDTGCVYGGSLTALVLPAGEPPPPPAERRACLVSVKARKRYHTPGLS